MKQTAVLAVIPILNPPKDFFTVILPSLQNQTLKADILLINSGDKIEMELGCEVRSISKQEFNHANTRNIALEYEADYYLFMTQDAMPYDDTLIANLLDGFREPSVKLAYARQIPYSDASMIEVFARTTNYPALSQIKSKEMLPKLGIKTFFSSDSCAMYKGEYFRSVGGFKKDLNTNEDMEFAALAIMDGKKVAYCAEARVYHSHNFSFVQLWSRYAEIGRFFVNNKWILDIVKKYKPIGASGVSQALSELKFVIKHNPRLLGRSVVASLIKYIAFKLEIFLYK